MERLWVGIVCALAAVIAVAAIYVAATNRPDPDVAWQNCAEHYPVKQCGDAP